MWTARRLSPVHKAVDGRKQNPRTRRHALSAGIYHWTCARGLLALEAARKRMDWADARGINLWSR